MFLFLGDALLAICDLINSVPFILHGQTPFTTLYKDINMFKLTPRVFGSLCFVHVLGKRHDKLILGQ